MAKDFEQMMHQLERSVLRTSQGSFVKLEDLAELVEEQGEALKKGVIDQLLGPRTFAQAKARVRADEEIMSHFNRDPKDQIVAESQNEESISAGL